MTITEKINEDLKTALKSGQKTALSVLRMLKSDFKYKQIELGRDLTEEDVLAVLASSAKKRLDAIEAFEKGGRNDLVAKEKAELEIISSYRPQQMTTEELEKILAEVIAETGASTPKDIGLVMKHLMPKVKGKIDGRKVNELVARKLNN